jgi:hypothetical protein
MLTVNRKRNAYEVFHNHVENLIKNENKVEFGNINGY